MLREDIEKNLDFDINTALKQFYRIYPECRAIPTDITYNGKGLVIFVNDSYHVITEHTTSRFYSSLEDAKRAEP